MTITSAITSGMTLKGIRAYISWYKTMRAIEENASKLSEYINANMPKNVTNDELLEFFDSAAERFDPLTGLFEDE